MSVVKTKEGKEDFPFPQNCFYCGNKVKLPFVHWMGSGEGKEITGWQPALNIVFHPKCVGKLFHKLLDDVESIQGSNQ